MSALTKQPKKATARTTTIRITPPADFVLLAEQYRLVRYVLPKSLITDRDYSKYARLHNELKEQLDAPYRVYTHDHLDEYEQWVVYVLYSRLDQPEEKTTVPNLRFERDLLPGGDLSFDKLEFHILIKLLQVAYFRGEQNSYKNRFVGQDKCYVYAKRRGRDSDKYHICLEIELKGDLQDENLFFVYGQARTFARQDAVDEAYSNRNTLYTFEIRDELLLFRQVKRSQVATTHPLYTRLTFAGSRTTLDFHDQDEVAASRGYLVDTFIKGFVQYLIHYGFEVEHKRREFQKHEEGDASDFQLPIDNLNLVYVLDKRLNPLYDLGAYVSVFQAQFPKVEFQVVSHIMADCTIPVLVFQDCTAGAFREEMPLYKQDDPHQRLYEQLPLVAKQFINVNGNIPDKGMSREDYLTYELELSGEQQVLMALNELFLKDLILRKRDVTTRLPLAPTNLMFVHLENRGRGEKKQGYEVAMYFEGNTVRFLNLRSQEESDEFYALTESFGVDWGIRYDEMRDKYKKRGEDENLNTYDVIVGPGLFVEIEDAHEALLYEYEEILRRIAEYDQPFPLDYLKLAVKYNQLIGDPYLSEEMLQLRGYIQQPRPLQSPKNQKQRDAVDLYFALHAYDNFLDSLKSRYADVSFRTLTGDDELLEQITRIFNTESARRLHNLYKNIGMFAGVREADVIPVYQGIWFTPDDLRYVVGDTNSMNSTQARAHRVRRFAIYQGAKKFDIRLMLDAMSVKFVRLKQYTVYPYYFHLIDLYIDNLLEYQIRSSANLQSKYKDADGTPS